MSAKVLKTINMDLSAKSIQNAIREVEKFRKDLQNMCQELAQRLTAEGAEIARMQVVSMDAWFTGELEASIQGVYFAEEHCGVIYTDCPHALFVEFGTGIVGESGPQHPWNSEYEWEHDTNGHGINGWWYPAPWGWWVPKKGKHAGETMAWTDGMVSRPFMYNTMVWIREAAEREGIRMFRDYARG